MMTRLIKALYIGIALGFVLPLCMARAQDDPYRQLIDEVDGNGIYEDAALGIVFDSTLVDVEDSGLSHVINHRLIKVLTWDGARQMTGLRFDYDPASSVFEPRKVIIHRADGTLVPVDVANAQDRPQPQWMIYWGPRMKVLELPRLSVGDAVEMITYKKGFQIAYLEEELPQDDERYVPPMRGHFYDSILFQEDYPLREKVYNMRISRQKPAQYKVYNGEVYSSLTFADDLLVYTFWMKDVPALKHEPRQPGASDFVPKVVLATVKDWPEKSRWFFEVNNEILQPDEVVSQKARDIVQGIKAEDEKIAAILHWTAQNIRYSGISMGKGEGYTLHSGMMTLNDRCGVCKDIAGMSIALLRGVGFTVYPAMTMAGARVENVPADQFNHCVVAVKRDNGSYTMIDPTWAPYAMSVWSRAEGEQHYVIGSPQGEERMAIRSFSADEIQTKVDLKGTLNAEGDLEGTITIEGTAYGDTRLRRGVAYTPAENHDALFANWVSHIAEDATVLNVVQSDIEDLSKPFRVQIRFRAPGYAMKAQDKLLFSPAAANFIQSAPRTFDLVNEFTADEREHPMHIWNARLVVVRESIKVPKGYSLANAPEVDDESGGDWASCNTTVALNGTELTTRLEYKVDQRTIPAQYYDEVKGAYDTLKDFAHQTWLLKKGS